MITTRARDEEAPRTGDDNPGTLAVPARGPADCVSVRTDMSRPDWLVLAYTLPPEPSRMRVSIWRRLRKLGAVYLDEGVWVTPNTQPLASQLSDIVRDIENFQGTATAFVSSDMDDAQTERLRTRFLAARNEEYDELQGQCRRFMLHVDHATKTERYTFAEVEELEEEIAKLERWLEEIRARDLFGSPEASACSRAIEAGRQALAEFTERTVAVSESAQRITNSGLALE